ncbi:MAG: glycolate oxidase subunit GlcE [Gammaproteobacteria bacterium]
MPGDRSDALREQVLEAAARNTALAITGGGTKQFYGREIAGAALSVADHAGIVGYEPKELVVTARAGTPLRELERVLAEEGQMLPFEPPHFGENATLGGAVAAGLSGPARPYTGSVRDFVLGVRLLNGEGEILRFGGEVMKNVAGYDVSRLVTGSLGAFGVILEVSLKVLPRPAAQLTLTRECAAEEAIRLMTGWAGQPLPLTAACHDGERLWVRLSGSRQAVDAAREELGGDEAKSGEAFWRDLREHRHPFLAAGDTVLWRLAVRPATPPLGLGEEWIDWGGGQRWLRSERPASEIRERASSAGGHALQFRGGDRKGEIFHPLQATVERIHRQLKRAFDPQGLFNPGRMYPAL